MPETTDIKVPVEDDHGLWAWSEADDSPPHGRFSTKEDAITHAKSYIKDWRGRYIWVGKVVTVEPQDFLPDFDSIAESIEISLVDTYGFDEGVLEFGDGAEEALNTALQEWCSKYVSTRHWAMEDTEKVHL